MVYQMRIYVDGGCRGNGYPNAIGAAAAVFQFKYGTQTWTERVMYSNKWGPPTNQRAEISAIILALEIALEKFDGLEYKPRLNVKIYSDSKYAIGCMTEWIYTWSNNGWRNSAGKQVANKDLILKASNLDDQLQEVGRLEYIWIPRARNVLADQACNELLDEMAWE